MKEKIKENKEKIKLNKTLPYLVGNVVEVELLFVLYLSVYLLLTRFWTLSLTERKMVQQWTWTRKDRESLQSSRHLPDRLEYSLICVYCIMLNSDRLLASYRPGRGR